MTFVHFALDLIGSVKILPHIDEENYSRVCMYLLSCANYVGEPEDTILRQVSSWLWRLGFFLREFQVVFSIYQNMNKPANALRVALAMNEPDEIVKVYNTVQDPYALLRAVVSMLT